MHVATIDYQANRASLHFAGSLRETGFAVLKQHPIDPQLVQDVYAEWQAFFNSPAKFDYLFDKQLQDGYFPFLSENAKGYAFKDLKEFYHVYLWGRFPSVLSDKTKQLYHDLTKLAETLLLWVEEHTPKGIAKQFSMPLAQMVSGSQKNLLRILHYPPLKGTEPQGSVRAAAHEDINLITLLPAATAPGLQVRDTQGLWHDVQCDLGSIVVNVGDMLQMCSDGYYPSTTHQVVNEHTQQSRLSMPLFLHPNDDVQLSSTYTAKSYLHERLHEIGLL